VEHPPPQCVPRAILHRSPASLLITSKGIEQPSGTGHDTAQSNKPPIIPTAYICSGGAFSSGIRTETRLGKRSSHDATSISYLRHSRHTLTLLQPSTCLRNTDMNQYTDTGRVVRSMLLWNTERD